MTAIAIAIGMQFDSAFHSIDNKVHEIPIALLITVDAPVTSERAYDHPPTDGRAAADSRTALFTRSLTHSLSLSLSPPHFHPHHS